MTGPTQKPPPTVADYKAAVEDLRAARAAAADAFNVAHAEGDVAKGVDLQSQLKEKFDAFRSFREGIPRKVLLSINAERILESFSVDKKKFLNIVIPADVSDEDAMHALNARFRDMFPDKERAAIDESEIAQILNAGSGSDRISRTPRIIRLIGVVPGTERRTRDQQADVLREKGLAFSHPIEQALAAAAYACKGSGEDLFKDLFVRGSVPGVALRTYQFNGVRVYRYEVDRDTYRVAASGSPFPELK